MEEARLAMNAGIVPDVGGQMTRALAILLIALLAAPSALADAVVREGFCVRLAAACDTQLLLRAGFGINVTSDDDFGRFFVLPTIGIMVDRGHHDFAVGAAAIAMIGEKARLGGEVPVRYWLGERTALELAPGILSNPTPGLTPTFRAGIYTHWVGLGLRYSRPHFDTFLADSGYADTKGRNELTLEAALTGAPGGIALAACIVGAFAVATVFLAGYEN